MPLHSLFSPMPGTLLALWTLEEPESDLLAYVQSRIDASALPTHPMRRREYLAARSAALHALDALGYTHSIIVRKDTGAPYAEGVWLSLSHCSGKAVAIVSTQSPVGVDLARYRTTMHRVQDKFLHKTEWPFAHDNPGELTRIWAAKESVYKRIGQKGLSLASSLQVLPSLHTGRSNVMAFGTTSYTVYFRPWEDSLIAYCV